MTIDDRIRHEKSQYDINRATAKVSTLSSSKIDMSSRQVKKCSPHNSNVIEHAKFLFTAWKDIRESRRENNLRSCNPWI